MARRSRGDGSVFYDAARGCWVGTVEIGRDPETRKRRRRKVSAPTKTECREKLAALLDEKRRTGSVPRRDTTVETIIRDRLANPPARVKSPISRQVHQVHGERIIAALGKTRIVNLTVADVERFLRGMAGHGYARKTISDTRGLLADAIRRAERDGLAGRNVAALAELPVARVKKSRAMTLAQIGQLLGSGLDPWMRAYVTTGIMCGLRPGELLQLEWSGVDLDQRVIRVRGDLKTEQSRRTLALPSAAAAALRAHRAQQAADRLRLGAHYDDRDLVFCRDDGVPWRRQGVYVRFRRACEQAGIGPDWHPHLMRHTFVSVLSDAGVTMEDIADSVGHVNSTITRSVYRHQLADTVARAAAAMDRIFGA
jgi:integrase